MTVARGREYFAYHPFRGTKRAGIRVALPGCPTLPNGEPNPAWWVAYRAASGTKPLKAKSGTFTALADAWRGSDGIKPSPEWEALKPNTQRNYRTALSRILSAWGDLPVRALEPRHVLHLRDEMRTIPQAANTLLTALSSMLNWSIPRGWRDTNPCDKVKSFPAGDPWLPWSPEALDTWREHSVPEMRRAMLLGLYTGQRLGDVLRMTWNDVDQGKICVVQEKTGKKVWIPLHRDLRAELDTTERPDRRSITILTGQRGRPWSRNGDGFKTIWGRQKDCIELLTGDCHGVVFHGLRKNAVCFMIEAGCTEEEVMAITGQSRQMVRYYALELNSRRLGEQAMVKWEARDA